METPHKTANVFPLREFLYIVSFLSPEIHSTCIHSSGSATQFRHRFALLFTKRYFSQWVRYGYPGLSHWRLLRRFDDLPFLLHAVKEISIGRTQRPGIFIVDPIVSPRECFNSSVSQTPCMFRYFQNLMHSTLLLLARKPPNVWEVLSPGVLSVTKRVADGFALVPQQ